MPGPLWILLRGLRRVKALCRNEAGTSKKAPGGMVNKNGSTWTAGLKHNSSQFSSLWCLSFFVYKKWV